MIRKHKIALFVNTSTTSTASWTRIKKSTELTLSFDAQTEDYDYIADEFPTTEVIRYKPSLDQPIKMIEGEPDFEFFWDLLFDLPTGESAKVDVLIAFMFDNTGTEQAPTYSAWKTKATLTFSDMNAVDSEISMNIALTDIVKGDVSVTGTAPDYVPTFTPRTEGVG